jgi:hypothetical protein
MGEETKQESGTKATTPWAGSIPHLNNIMATGEGLFRSGQGTQMYPGSTQAPTNPTLNTAYGSIAHNAMASPGNNQIPWANALSQQTSGGLSPEMQAQIGKLQGMAGGDDNNPYLQQMLNTQADRLRNQVGSSMSGAGRYGSAGHQDALVRSISEAQNPILMQAYENNRNRMLQANQAILGAQGQGAQRSLGYAALSPELDNLSYRPFERLGAVGDFLQGREQSALDADVARFDKAQLMPWENLSRYGAALGYTSPFAANATTTNATSTTKQPNSFMDYMKLFTPNTSGDSTAGVLASLLRL